MQRHEFLKLISSGALLACSGCLNSCAPDYIDPAPKDINFTLDLLDIENASLTPIGGSLIKNGVIVARITSTEYIAISQTCTHETISVNFQSAEKNFLCPRHGSKFDRNGNAINGPATKPLHKYNVEFNAGILRVFS